MRVTCEKDEVANGVVHAHVGGRLDAAYADEFFDKLTTELGRGSASVLIDMTGLEYISSAGVGALIRLLTRLRQGGGRLAVYGCNHRVQTVLKVTCLGVAVNLSATADEGRTRLLGPSRECDQTIPQVRESNT